MKKSTRQLLRMFDIVSAEYYYFGDKRIKYLRDNFDIDCGVEYAYWRFKENELEKELDIIREHIWLPKKEESI